MTSQSVSDSHWKLVKLCFHTPCSWENHLIISLTHTHICISLQGILIEFNCNTINYSLPISPIRFPTKQKNNVFVIYHFLVLSCMSLFQLQVWLWGDIFSVIILHGKTLRVSLLGEGNWDPCCQNAKIIITCGFLRKTSDKDQLSSALKADMLISGCLKHCD